MRPKLLYCLALIAALFILSFTVLSKDTKRPCMLSCKKIEIPSDEVATELIFLESLTKHLIISFK